MDDTQFRILIEKITILEKLIAMNIVNGKKVSEQVKMLYSIGIPISEIAEILGTKKDNINQYVYRKEKTSKKKSSKS